MISIFKKNASTYYALQSQNPLSESDDNKLIWLFGNANKVESLEVSGQFVGPRREMVTPWSTNAVEITQNMGILGIQRIEEFTTSSDFDPMLMHQYDAIDQEIFTIHNMPDEILAIDNISDYNQQEGLALSFEEIEYLENVSKDLGRKLTDSEVFGFSQVNSEHCRHKIFNGTFIIDGQEKPESLFKNIRKTSNKKWGLIGRLGDYEQFIDEKADLIEIHLTWRELINPKIITKNYNTELIVHAPEYFNDQLIDFTSDNKKILNNSFEMIENLNNLVEKIKNNFVYDYKKGPKVVLHPG
ncbi:MAG: hypothetical protein NWS46_04480, partial [Cyclobacteriaceae bacterium]|nr:hypothetical protein [Cyclobacteriaceae bacterium]